MSYYMVHSVGKYCSNSQQTYKAIMTGWSLDRLISGEFKHASDPRLLNTLWFAVISCNEIDNGNGTPACMHTKACSGQETENLFGVA